MWLLSRLVQIYTRKRTWAQSRKSGSLEGRQTGSSGGMSTTELLIRLELVMGQDGKLPLIDYANKMAKLSHPLQLYIFEQINWLSDLSYTHADKFLQIAPEALTAMEQKEYQRWLSQIKQALTGNDSASADALLIDYQSFLSLSDKTAYLSDITYNLEKLTYSLLKQELVIHEAEQTSEQSIAFYTDHDALYLPNSIQLFDKDNNLRLYKVMTFHLISQIQQHSEQALGQLNEAIKYHGQDFLALFSTIETLRIDQCIQHDYPGIWREISQLNTLTAVTYPEELFVGQDIRTVQSSLHLTASLLESTDRVLPTLSYQPVFNIDLMAKAQRLVHQRRAPLILNPTKDVDESLLDTTGDPRIADRGYLRSVNNNQDGSSVLASPPPGWIPAEAAQQEEEEVTVKHHEKGVFYYREWDTSLKKYRQDWCKLKEIVELPSDAVANIEQTQALRHAEYKIRKTFDKLINDQKFMRAQADGDEVDIDAWVSARTNPRRDSDDFQNVYIRNNRNNRNIAIMFAVDLSGSTSGWKNEMIKQSTWLLCKTLARLGDQYAVYGFSGSGRKQCEIFPVKTFNEAYSAAVDTRISAMKPHQYTRMGAAIRHLSNILGKTTAKTRILFVLTDGRPDDLDSYRGQYGVEDTRIALNEAKALSLKPFVLTFDKEGMDYLPYMLGSNRYQLITDIGQLPIQISTIYKQLTT